MRVLKIELGNFRGLERETDEGERLPSVPLAFDPAFNVMIGVNGIGKTSILDALAILLSRLLPRFTPARGGHRHFAPSDQRVGSRSGITGELWLECEGEQIVYRLTEAAREGGKLTEDWPRPQVRQLAQRYERDNPDSRVSVPIALLYTTDRASFRLPQQAKELPTERASAYQGVLQEKTVNYGFLIEWLQGRQYLAERGDEAARHLLAVTEQALGRFLPAFGKVEVEGDPPRLYVRKWRKGGPSEGVRLGIEQLSDGERSFLAMVLDIARHLAQANPAAADPLETGQGVVLIDELELHLHPKWQREVVTSLQETFPALQFITTTHSPFVVQSLRPGQLINLDPESFVEGFEEEYANQSIEDITEAVFDVELPQKSQRYLDQMRVAEEYFRLLREVPQASPEKRERLKRELDRLSIPFSDDPAYMALLKMEREATFGKDDDATH